MLFNLKIRVVFLAIVLFGVDAFGDAGVAYSQARNKVFPDKEKQDDVFKKKTSPDVDLLNKVKMNQKCDCFPNWATSGFSWSLRPILGAKTTSTVSEDGKRVDTFTTEAGAQAHLKSIPIIDNNPGAFLGVLAGGARGTTAITKRSDDLELEALTYKRVFGELSLIVPFHFYKHTLTFGRGKKVTDSDPEDVLQTMTLSNDMGVLVYRWLSTHLTQRYLRLFENQYTKPLFEEQDFWLHARFFTDFQNASFDLGPGVTQGVLYAMENDENVQIASGHSRYLKALGAMDIVWKIKFDFFAKYVLSSNEERLGQYANTGLPNEGVHAPRSLSMPEDSGILNSTVGVANLFRGIGIAWIYNIQVLNLSEKNNSERSTERYQGLRASYAISI